MDDIVQSDSLERERERGGDKKILTSVLETQIGLLLVGPVTGSKKTLYLECGLAGDTWPSLGPWVWRVPEGVSPFSLPNAFV